MNAVYAFKNIRSYDTKATFPGTCGELVQGIFQGQEFLINSPIPLYASVSVEIMQGSGIEVQTEGNWTKVRKAVEKTLYSISPSSSLAARLSITSQLPRGKGFASSTADMTAAICAVGQAFGIQFSDQFITDILISIDNSSDAVYLPGISALHQLNGKHILSLGNPPPIRFIAVDNGGEIDTHDFDRQKARAVAGKHQDFYSWCLKSMNRAFTFGDSRTIAYLATESARINQEIIFKSFFDDLVQVATEFDGLGVNCAHTGSTLGVMYDPRKCDAERLESQIEKVVGKERILGNFPLISGGRYATSEQGAML